MREGKAFVEFLIGWKLLNIGFSFSRCWKSRY